MVEHASYQKRILISGIGIIGITILLLVLFVGKAYAGDFFTIDENLKSTEYETYEVDEDGIADLIRIFGDTEMYAKHREAQGLSSEKVREEGSLASNLLYDEDSLAVWGAGICKILAIILLFIHALNRIIDMLREDEASIEEWIRIFLLSILSILAISYYDIIIEWIEKLGVEFYGLIQEKYFENIPKTVTVSSVNAAGYAILGGVFKLASKILYYSIFASEYGLLFELVLRKILMPIALSDLFINGERSTGFLFLKMYLSMFIRMGLFAVILTLYQATLAFVTATEFNLSMLGYFGSLLCVQMATKALMTASGDLSKEVVQ